MKKLIVLLLLVLSLTLIGCKGNKNDSLVTTPPVETLPLPLPDDTEQENTEDERKKKTYVISCTNGLNVRSKPNATSTVLGSLDKNDLVLYLGEDGSFYKTTFREKTAYISKKYSSILEIEPDSLEVEKAIDLGSALLGHPYVWGSERYHWGNGKLNSNFVKGEFDCSALVQYVYYKSNGVILDLTSRTQSLNGKAVKRTDLKRGDLMFFTNASRKNKTGIERIGHVGIYFGNNYILHTASDHAVIEPISTTRWGYYITARRVV